MGYSYYSAVVMWTVLLPMDLHVKGAVNVHAYISSGYSLTGLFSGGGYSMGVVDIDENNREVKEFISSASYKVGNPFTSNPTQYSQSVNVDYTFSKGHTLAFVVGLGATVQGYTASVYFGSADRASGATLPIDPIFQTQSVQTDMGPITVVADAAVSNLQYDKTAHAITYNAAGIDGTPCSCTVNVPKMLVQAPFTVTQGTKTLQATTSQNETHTQISYTHTVSDSQLRVIGSAANDTPNPQTQSPTTSQTPAGSPSTASPVTTEPSQLTSKPTGSTSPSSIAQPSSSPNHTPQVPEAGVYVIAVLIGLCVAIVTLRILRKRIHKLE